MKYLILFFSIILIFDKFYSQTNKVEVIDNPIKITPNERLLNMQFGWSVDVHNDLLFVGTPVYNSKLNRELGCVFIYKLNGNKIIETHKLTPSVLKNNVNFGSSVKISEGIFLVSSGGMNNISSTTKKNITNENINVAYGSIEVMTPLELIKGRSMKRDVILHKDTKSDVGFADKIDVSDEYLITSLPFYSNNNNTVGKVVIYKQVNETKFEIFIEIIPPENTTYFGKSVAIEGNDIIIGASGEVFIYTISKTDSTTKLIAHLKQQNRVNFGDNVAIVNNYAFITNKNDIPPYFGSKIPDTDSVFSMVMLNENGGATQLLVPNEVNEKLKYGISDELFRQEATPVCDSITAYKQLEFSEEVIVYKKNNDNVWKYHQTLHSNRRAPFEFFGNSIDAKDSICVVGAFSSPITYEFNNANAYAGAAFVFELQKDGFWKLTKKLIPKKREYWTKFGFSVATDGKSVVVGSRFDNTDKDYDNYIDNAGAVYYYSIRK